MMHDKTTAATAEAIESRRKSRTRAAKPMTAVEAELMGYEAKMFARALRLALYGLESQAGSVVIEPMDGRALQELAWEVERRVRDIYADQHGGDEG